MTARADAIEVIAETARSWLYGDDGTNPTLTECHMLACAIVDSFDPVMLARLAIERGGLVAIDHDDGDYWTYKVCDADVPLYRLVKR